MSVLGYRTLSLCYSRQTGIFKQYFKDFHNFYEVFVQRTLRLSLHRSETPKKLAKFCLLVSGFFVELHLEEMMSFLPKISIFIISLSKQ